MSQSLRAVEIIVVDDGSTDDTESRVRAYRDRVQYVRTENGGTAHARNVGMKHAAGRYLTFLDSDDLLYPYALELQAALLDRFPEAAMACAEMTGFDDRGWEERYHLKHYHESAYRDPRINYQTIFDSSLALGESLQLPSALTQEDPDAGRRRVYFGNVFDTYLLKLVLCQNTAVIRREVIAAVGERNIAVNYWEEVDYLLRITRRYRICFVDAPTYKLRYHEDQISSTAGSRGKYVWARKQQILLRVVKRHALSDPAYYQTHQKRIDRTLATLHRAVAVPLLLLDDQADMRRWAKRARPYLDRCRRHGDSVRVLRLASVMPSPFRALAVSVVESIRKVYWAMRRHLPVGGNGVTHRYSPSPDPKAG